MVTIEHWKLPAGIRTSRTLKKSYLRYIESITKTDRVMVILNTNRQDAQLSQRDRAAGVRYSFGQK